jgi:hypothetical protein
LVMTMLKVTLEPELTLVTVALLSMARSATGLTVKSAVTVVALLPTEVVSDPGGIVFVPLKMPVTTRDTEHDAPGGMTVPELTEKDPAPTMAVTVELAHVVLGNGADELVIPVG